VGENVYNYHDQGVPFFKAAVMGAREVALPVTFSILTNVATFLPLYFMPGIPGKIFKAIPIVVITVIVISLIESLFVLPAHLGHLKDRAKLGPMAFFHKAQQWFSRGFSRMIRTVYGPIVAQALRNRYVTLCCGAAVLMIMLAFVQTGRMGMTLFERIESDFAQVIAVLPYGSAPERTRAVQADLVKAAQEIARENGRDRLVKGIFAEIGATSRSSSGGHISRVRVFLTPPEERPMQTAEFVKAWRRRVGELAGLESLVFKSDAGGPGSRAALTVELSHRNPNVLAAASAELAEGLGYFPTVKDIDDGFQPGKQQIDFAVRPEGRALGLTAREIAEQVRHAFYGAQVLRQQRGRNEVKVMVRLPEKERESEHILEEFIVRTPSGKDVPLRDVVRIQRGRAYTNIDRRAGRRIVTVTADVNPPSKVNQVLTSTKQDILPGLTTRYPGLRTGFEGRQADMRDSLKSLGIGVLMAMLVVYGLLAIPFRSYIQPAIIMSSIPFGLIGAVLGHLIMGYSLSIMSMFGMVALTGVVVNDSLVFINFANRERKKGLSARDALVAAGILRFRPIILTSLTTFGALLPMIFETSRQARFLIPMAISLGFGVLFATFITLLLVPSLYLIVEDIRHLAGLSDRMPMEQAKKSVP
jgi:multidrug efflux pump subunit AcrB